MAAVECGIMTLQPVMKIIVKLALGGDSSKK